ncbi:hypothetical protein BM86_12370, partial [Bacillus thuringiensis]|nr:hypothetical protein [Bacillus thuringiensis]MBH0336270.1 hypothetical protein [Bacillus thuringiensis]
MGYFKGKQF